MPASIPIEVFGKHYKSITSACRAFGHTESKVRHRMGMGASFEDALISKDRYTGAKKHPNYGSWNAMVSRCQSNGNGAAYRNYKGKGISVCERWLKSFWDFVEDMGVKPTPDHTIERNGNKLGYSSENCRWATRIEQGRNRSDNVAIGDFGTLKEASESTGIPSDVLSWRKRNGWPDELSLSTPASRSNTHIRRI